MSCHFGYTLSYLPFFLLIARSVAPSSHSSAIKQVRSLYLQQHNGQIKKEAQCASLPPSSPSSVVVVVVSHFPLPFPLLLLPQYFLSSPSPHLLYGGLCLHNMHSIPVSCPQEYFRKASVVWIGRRGGTDGGETETSATKIRRRVLVCCGGWS